MQLDAGELGQRFKSRRPIEQTVRASGGWRATWKGEGGGVLLNQCLHNLDAMQWLLGMPARVRGFCQLGRFHQIEVEDSVTAYLEWANGATGVFVTSTGESPGTNRFEIVGTRGRLVLENDQLTFTRNETDMIQFSQTAKQGFVKGGINRVLLATDGDFNVGVTSEGELVRLIAEKAKSGVFLSVLGFGRGNLKDSTMEQLADKGDGNYTYVDNLDEARRALVDNMVSTLQVIALDAKTGKVLWSTQIADPEWTTYAIEADGTRRQWAEVELPTVLSLAPSLFPSRPEATYAAVGDMQGGWKTKEADNDHRNQPANFEYRIPGHCQPGLH